jgi:hypothetical protein
MSERWPCPYYLCQERPLLVGPKQSVIRKHSYEGYGDCPGSGYDIKKPAAEQDKLLAERARSLLAAERPEVEVGPGYRVYSDQEDNEFLGEADPSDPDDWSNR